MIFLQHNTSNIAFLVMQEVGHLCQICLFETSKSLFISCHLSVSLLYSIIFLLNWSSSAPTMSFFSFSSVSTFTSCLSSFSVCVCFLEPCQIELVIICFYPLRMCIQVSCGYVSVCVSLCLWERRLSASIIQRFSVYCVAHKCLWWERNRRIRETGRSRGKTELMDRWG